ncbi:MAG: hypothetical protein KDB21_10370 [Acidimicrobiales bacterium]|nr:hypothetical protein [Acidimicrobiales bacterium]
MERSDLLEVMRSAAGAQHLDGPRGISVPDGHKPWTNGWIDGLRVDWGDGQPLDIVGVPADSAVGLSERFSPCDLRVELHGLPNDRSHSYHLSYRDGRICHGSLDTSAPSGSVSMDWQDLLDWSCGGAFLVGARVLDPEVITGDVCVLSFFEGVLQLLEGWQTNQRRAAVHRLAWQQALSEAA